jgi:hypothetical protein
MSKHNLNSPPSNAHVPRDELRHLRDLSVTFRHIIEQAEPTESIDSGFIQITISDVDWRKGTADAQALFPRLRIPSVLRRSKANT